MKEKQIINISNCEENIQKKFYQSVDKLGEKIFFLISSLNYRIILANKYSDVFLDKHLIKSFDETKIYKENYKKENIDKIFRGICSDTIKAICVFTNNVNINNIDFVLYHEVGHFLDIYNKTGIFKEFYLSSKEEFVTAYKKDIIKHWDDIKQDKRNHLLHLVQDSSPKNISKIAVAETFANCFAKMMDSTDTIDFIGLYFKNSTKIGEEIINNFINNL